ncbi:MAG: FtsX-like permease family protein [Planctomycetia bacterium]|nr:FtsX-like permease family protein [Planctomycetia bacterium]
MKILFRLVYRELTRRTTRTALAVLAILTTSCLVVWFVGNLNLSGMTSKRQAKEYFGEYSLAFYVPQGTFEEDWVAALRKQPGIDRLDLAYGTSPQLAWANTENALAEQIRRSLGTPLRCPNLLGLDSRTAPFEMEEGRWYQNPWECVLSTATAEQLAGGMPGAKADGAVKVGDFIAVDTPEGEKKLKVVGIFKRSARQGGGRGSMGTFAFGFGVGIGGGPKTRNSAPARTSPVGPQQPGGSGPSRSAAAPPMMGGISPTSACVYVSLADAYVLSGEKDKTNMAYVTLKKGETPTEFYAALEKTLGRKLSGMGVQTLDVPAMQEAIEQQQTGNSLLTQVWSAIGLVLLASIFIIFTTLSMGVTERVRQLAMLRTLGLTKVQVAACILLEGVVLGFLGWLGGLAAGWVVLEISAYVRSGEWVLAVLTPQCLGISLLCSLAGSMLASILPAIRATRVSPVESMVRTRWNLTVFQLTGAAVLGLALLAVLPWIVFGMDAETTIRVFLFSTMGTLCMAAGFLLFFPWTIVFTEKAFGPVVARLLGFSPRFLSNQLSGHQWRTLGTALAVSIGLGLFTAVQIWSHSMLNIFEIPKNIPNTLVAFLPAGVEGKDVKEMKKMPWMVEDDFMPVMVEQPSFDLESMEKWREGNAIGMDCAVLMGVDPQIAFRAENPTLDLRFIEGSRVEALRALCDTQTHSCIVSDAFSQHSGLHVGDTVRLVSTAGTPRRGGMGGGMGGPGEGRGGGRPEGQTPPPPGEGRGGMGGGRPGMGGMGGGMGATAESNVVEYTIAGVVELPGWQWFSKRSGVRVNGGRSGALIFTSYHQVKFDFPTAPEYAFFWFNTKPGTPYETVFDVMQEIAKRSSNAFEQTEETRLSRSVRGMNQGVAQVSTVDSLNESLFSRANSVIDMMARMPLMILILSTIAVLNTMVIAVRSRRWEMGVLRACGVTRWGLIRMVLAESLLIGLCACVMSLTFGLFYAWLANGMVLYTGLFGSIAPPMVVPWEKLAWGYGLALAVSIAASLYPAFWIGRQETTALLQQKD